MCPHSYFFKNQSSFVRSTFIFFKYVDFLCFDFRDLGVSNIVWIGIALVISFPIVLVFSLVLLAICCTFYWIFVVPSILIGGTLTTLGYGYGTCEIIISEYDYRQMLGRVEALGYNTQALQDRACWGGLCIVGKRIGLTNNVQIIQLEENFDESVPAERQEYQNFLRREAKGITYFTHQMGSQHGRPLDILLDEDRSNRNYRPIY
ncbi:uncharacterized protein OCT59_006673 [Rhizophagus irregularis]|uniref:uncharacterized protein n=1 Tax=Rhizophagus irregularis TaxID=588596 RepID=UPI0033271681|nr:hypothetical protein OCT59_006673 [Rhizophagus irregularis]